MLRFVQEPVEQVEVVSHEVERGQAEVPAGQRREGDLHEDRYQASRNLGQLPVLVRGPGRRDEVGTPDDEMPFVLPRCLGRITSRLS